MLTICWLKLGKIFVFLKNKDFIKQFFEEEDEPLEQKDFLAEFFEELEEEAEKESNS